MFQQDDAPSQLSSSEVNCRVPVAYRAELHRPSLWPPDIQDLNPVDYRPTVWGALQQNVYRIPISNLDDLKDKSAHLHRSSINKSIDQWHGRLKTVVRVNGGHSEQLF